jgi:Domain of unknown function (DUF4917)
MIDASLPSWDRVKRDLPGEYLGLLLGNGASIALWDGFSYRQLHELACDERRQFHLTPEDREIFDNFGEGGNFESVLSGLWTAKTIGEILGNRDTHRIWERYESIKRSLFQAINDLHVPHAALKDAAKATGVWKTTQALSYPSSASVGGRFEDLHLRHGCQSTWNAPQTTTTRCFVRGRGD